MELLYWFNVFVLAFGYRSAMGLLNSMGNCNSNAIKKYSLRMILYVLLSIHSLWHYFIEPPRVFTFWKNVMIIGEAMVSWALAVCISRISYLNEKQRFVSPQKDLQQLIDQEINNVYDVEDEDIETFDRIKVDKVRNRSPGSRTPSEG